jgi:formiminoglutamase
MIISQMIWYYLEGLDQRIIEDVNNTSYIQTFMVELSDYNLSLKFLQSKKTGRWWVEIPLNEDKESYFMPCSEEDFDKARNNDLSYRIFNELSL